MLQSGRVSNAFPQLAGMDMDNDGRITALDFFRFNIYFRSVNTSKPGEVIVAVFKSGNACWGTRFILITDDDMRCLLTEFTKNGVEIKDLTQYPTLNKMDTNTNRAVDFNEFMSFVNKTGFVNNIATTIGKAKKYNAAMVGSLKTEYYNLVVTTINNCGLRPPSLYQPPSILWYPEDFDCIKKAFGDVG